MKLTGTAGRVLLARLNAVRLQGKRAAENDNFLPPVLPKEPANNGRAENEGAHVNHATLAKSP